MTDSPVGEGGTGERGVNISTSSSTSVSRVFTLSPPIGPLFCFSRFELRSVEDTRSKQIQKKIYNDKAINISLRLFVVVLIMCFFCVFFLV